MASGRRKSANLLLLAIGVAGVPLQSPASAAKAGSTVPNSYICEFREGLLSPTFEAHRTVGEQGGTVTHIYQHVIRGFAAHLSQQAVSRMLQKDPQIARCEADRIASLPGGEGNVSTAVGRPGGGGGGGGQSKETIPWGVKRVGGPGTWNGHPAWVVDTGVDLDHPELNVDVGRSRVFLTSDPFGDVNSKDDFNGHGTHVSGTIAAKQNGVGVVGVAPGATIVSVRVLDALGSAPDSDVLQGLDYVSSAAATGDVVNLSLEADSDILNTAVLNLGGQGLFVVIAAGNETTNVDTGNGGAGVSPAKVEGTRIFTVSASDSRDQIASFSNFGPSVDYAEPGVRIPSLDKNGGYATKSGTSMSAPHLSGILLVTGGPVSAGGPLKGDPDGQVDQIGVLP